MQRVTAESQTVEAALQCIGEKETERSLLSSQLKTMSQINEEMLAKLPVGPYRYRHGVMCTNRMVITKTMRIL